MMNLVSVLNIVFKLVFFMYFFLSIFFGIKIFNLICVDVILMWVYNLYELYVILVVIYFE